MFVIYKQNKVIITGTMGNCFSDEPDAVKLIVYTREKKLVFEVYLCSVEADSWIENIYKHAQIVFPGMREAVGDSFTVLPVILCKGNITTRNIFFEWLQVPILLLFYC